ncbi:MAG TPA: prepilin-type N-terminal cleavage/methylation domain-containing protein [Candidatus Desulfaltia sp.]|nr:prepilin-type N-terminal cleavage/methylation domain-containing protein [Candidatus Desulfaltia sp.]
MKKRKRQESQRGFTMIELLVGSTVMLILIIATLSLYMRSNKVAVDQNMYAELQHDVRSAMYFVARDIRMSGVGLPIEFQGYYFEGTDNEDQGGGVEVTPDRLLMMGNIEDPLNLIIQSYNGSSITLSLDDYSYELYPYPDEYYEDKIVLILPNPASDCRSGQVRQITHVTHSTGGGNEKLNFSPGLAPGINPPGGLSGTCDESSDYDGGLVTFIDVKEFWLDITGNYPGLTAGVNGYVGNGRGDILYMTLNGIHYPISQNVENLQFEYNGDLDDDGDLDGFLPWQTTWMLDEIGRIREIRIMIQGSTPRAFVSVSGTPDPNRNVYKRPPLSNTAGGAQPDRHKRFLLESTSNIRNLSLNLYNSGTR